MDFGGSGGVGGIDGGDGGAVANAALAGLTSGRTWKEKVVIKDHLSDLVEALSIPSFTTLQINGMVTLADGIQVNIVENADLVNGNTRISIIGNGLLNGNGVNQTDGENNLSQCGVLFRGVSFFEIKNLWVYDTYYSNIRVAESSGNVSCRQGQVIANHLQKTTYGSQTASDNISLRGVSAANPVKYVLISSNICLDAGRTGIELSTGCLGIQILNNLVKDSTGRALGPHGVTPSGITYDVIIIGNELRDSGTHGISGGAIEHFLIANNNIHDNTNYGIYFPFSDAKYGVFIGNTLRSNGDGPVTVATAVDMRFYNNRGYNPRGYIENASWGASAWTFTNDYFVPIDIYISGGTISSITKGGQAINTSGWIHLDCQESIIITYSSSGTLKVFGQ